VAFALTEAPDVASVQLEARHEVAFALTEAPDVASVQLEARHEVALAATEEPDVITAAVVRNVPFAASAGVFTLQGNDAALAASRFLYPATGQYSQDGRVAILAHYRRLNARSANYIISGRIARLYQSSFFYNDVEIIFVPPEIQHAELVFENRVVLVNADWTVERLAEDREASGEPRLRAV
jgi:hypothetical protein